MTDIRNSVLFVAPTSHLVGFYRAGSGYRLTFYEWNGDPDLWAKTPVGSIVVTAGEMGSFFQTLYSLLHGTASGSVVSTPFTLDNTATWAGRASVSIEWSGEGPFYLDNVRDYTTAAWQAASASYPDVYTPFDASADAYRGSYAEKFQDTLQQSLTS